MASMVRLAACSAVLALGSVRYPFKVGFQEREHIVPFHFLGEPHSEFEVLVVFLQHAIDYAVAGSVCRCVALKSIRQKHHRPPPPCRMHV